MGPRSFVQLGRKCIAVIDLGRVLPSYEMLQIVECSLDDHKIIESKISTKILKSKFLDFKATTPWSWAISELEHQHDELPGLHKVGSTTFFGFHAFKTSSSKSQSFRIECRIAIVPITFRVEEDHEDHGHAVAPGGMSPVPDDLGPPWDSWESVIGPFQ